MDLTFIRRKSPHRGTVTRGRLAFPMAALLAQFEETCRQLQLPASRASAEQALGEFAKSPDVLDSCRAVLDSTVEATVRGGEEETAYRAVVVSRVGAHRSRQRTLTLPPPPPPPPPGCNSTL